MGTPRSHRRIQPNFPDRAARLFRYFMPNNRHKGCDRAYSGPANGTAADEGQERKTKSLRPSATRLGRIAGRAHAGPIATIVAASSRIGGR
jgi:hypothetical protein